MMQSILYASIMTSSIMFIQMNHPLSMGLMLMMQTLQICLLTGLMTKTFWFSYILFLIFVGGMLVLFIYMTTLASNEMFSTSMKMTIIYMLMFMMLLTTNYFINKMHPPIMKMMEMNTINQLNNYMPENVLTLNKLYNYPTNMLTIMLMNYLLITLIAVVKITNLYYGPLRLMN